MRVKIKSTRNEKRVQVPLEGYYIEVNKVYKEVSPTEYKTLFETHQELLDFDQPELYSVLENVQHVIEENKKLKAEKAKEKETADAVPKVSDVSISKELEAKMNLMTRFELDNYASTEYGISLDRRQSLKNMIKELKKELK